MKPKRYWLRGGLLVLAILAINTLIIVLGTALSPTLFHEECSIGPSTPCQKTILGMVVSVVTKIIAWPGEAISNLLLNFASPNIFSLYAVFAVMILWYFLIGAVIGWLYGKLKK